MFGFGYDGDDGKSVSALRDMFDGGGSGHSAAAIGRPFC